MRILFIFFFILSSCATRNMAYNHKRLIKKALKNYTFFIDNEKADFRNIVLDKHNIKSVVMRRKTKEVYITQIKNNLVFVKDMNLDTLFLKHGISNKKFNGLVVIGGMPYDIEKVQIDTTIIKEIQLRKLNWKFIVCKPAKDVLFIITKK